MQRRKFLKAAAASMAVAAPLIATSKSATADDKVRFRMQRYWGTETDHLHKNFSKELRKISDGTVNITHFRGGELVPNDQMFAAVAKGSLDMAQGYGGYWPGQIDIGKIESGLPGAWSTYDEAQFIWEGQGLLELVREAYAEKGVYFMLPMFNGPYELLTTKPVKSLEDLKSMKIRATSTMASIFNQFDIPTTYVPAEELYVSLSTGVIDGLVYGGPLEYKALKLNEVAKHYTRLNLIDPGAVDSIIINMERWNSLSEKQQLAMKMACRTLAHDHHTWNMNGQLTVASEGLFEFSTLPEADSKALTEAALNTWKDEAAKSERNKKAIDILTKVAKATGRV
ncbi:TRAP transporter substrate-binding protein DctP [Amphritea sp. 1_MG-2023]|uniref:TRAP transporter substrate-binding protein DctP n=1 Tax=Amphritea sp. 1_MG-2023 TaxID=3062670 RepID=UPI0026E16ACE|nr:TRAP transporter substrate-binding protein DctP [Amphritea sp. 1_MG-2023]MDO6565081.1 TRAP transporter substrate-binding protein DctP [Amphritea sp. 1_MG-2023]